MSGEPKTLTLTPEEILLAARDKDFVLVPTRTVETRELRWSLHKVTVVGSRREIDYLAGFDTLSQAGAWLLGVPVVARDEASDNEGVDLEHCACCGQQFHANHLDHDTLTCQNCISAAVDLYHSQGEAAELRAENERLRSELAAVHHSWGVTTEALDEARDEAAELRAAVREYLAAMDALDGPATGWSVAETNRAVDALNELRRLAGGETS